MIIFVSLSPTTKNVKRKKLNMKRTQRSFLLQFDRILSQDIFRQALILLSLLAAVFVVSFLMLSISGHDWINYCKENYISKWVFPLYLLIDGNAFSGFCSDDNVSGTTVFIACLIYVAGVIIFTGMLISVMTNMIERRVDNYREGRIYYLKSGHYIIMGFDDMVPSFINYIFEKAPGAYVLILTSVKVSDATEKLRKVFGKEEMKHIIINYGHRTTSESYKDIHLETAEEIFIVGHHSKPVHDAINVECVDCIYRYLKDNQVQGLPIRITCVFRDLDTYSAFKTTDIFEKITKLGVEFVPYNFFTGWAKQVFVDCNYKDMDDPNRQAKVEYPTVYGNGIGPDDPRFVHLVFVGTTNFAVAFAMEAAHILHFPNFVKNKNLKTRITFIDLNADFEKDEFITRNRHFFEVQGYIYKDLSDKPELQENWPDTSATYFKGSNSNFLDVEFEFIKGNIFSQKVQKEISKWAKAKDEQYLSIFLAMEDQRNNFVMGMNMPDEVYENDISIFIRQDRSDNFVTNLREVDKKQEYDYYRLRGDKAKKKKRNGRYAHIYPFGMNETTYDADDESLNRAKLINYLYNTMDGNKFKSLSELKPIPLKDLIDEANGFWNGVPDDNQKPGLPVSLKWSNLYNAYTLKTKLASLRVMRKSVTDEMEKKSEFLSPNEINMMAEVEHNRWNVEKLLMGYRKAHKDEDLYETDDAEAKTKLKSNRKLFIHHDIRPFDDLSGIVELDREFSKYIPWIIQKTSKEGNKSFLEL